MTAKPTYEELERRVQELEKIEFERNQGEDIVQDGQYRWLVENANELILVAQDGLIRFVNQKASDYLGYSPEELKDTPFIQYIYSEDREKVSERHLKRLKGEDLPGVYPFRVVDRDGKVRWVEINAVLSEWNGKPATFNYINDITKRKRAEEALIESEALFRGMFKDHSAAMLLIDPSTGQIVEANQAAAQYYGYPLENMIQMKIQVVVEKNNLVFPNKNLFFQA